MIPLPPQQWAGQIFGCADLGDKRRTKRLVQVVGHLSANTGSSLAAFCCGNLAAVEGAYRLIENESVEPDAIAEAGFQATAHAANYSRLMLAIEDSTVLSYRHSARSELGDVGGPKNSLSKGIWAHSVMLLNADSERTIGLIDQQRWIRGDEAIGNYVVNVPQRVGKKVAGAIQSERESRVSRSFGKAGQSCRIDSTPSE